MSNVLLQFSIVFLIFFFVSLIVEVNRQTSSQLYSIFFSILLLLVCLLLKQIEFGDFMISFSNPDFFEDKDSTTRRRKVSRPNSGQIKQFHFGETIEIMAEFCARFYFGVNAIA